MNTQMQPLVKADSVAPAAFLRAPAGLLQRTCACGGSPGVEGECAACRQKQLALQSPAVSPPPAPDAHALTPRLGHDLSRIGIYANRNAQQTARTNGGGELLEDDPERQTVLGGDGGGSGAVAGILQRQSGGTGGGAAAPAASLTYSTVTPRTSQGCGGYEYAVRWGLNNASSSTNGFVVQKLQFNLQRDICAGGTNNFSKTYWEAWQVRGGQIFVGTSSSPHRADTFRVGPTIDQRGVNLEEGNAKFIEGYTAPLTWGTVPEAGSLPATETQPTGWSDSGTLYRSIQVDFDCCDQSDPGIITGQG